MKKRSRISRMLAAKRSIKTISIIALNATIGDRARVIIPRMATCVKNRAGSGVPAR
jgi:hypothetical protein